MRLLATLLLVVTASAHAATFAEDAAKIQAILQSATVGSRFAEHQGIDQVIKDPDNGDVLNYRLTNGRCTLKIQMKANGSDFEVTDVGRWMCGV